MDFMIEMGEDCTFEESLVEAMILVDRCKRAEKAASPDAPLYCVHWSAHSGTVKSKGSPVTIETVRAVLNKPALQPNDTWRDGFASYRLLPAEGQNLSQ